MSIGKQLSMGSIYTTNLFAVRSNSKFNESRVYKICSNKILHAELERIKDIQIKNRYQ